MELKKKARRIVVSSGLSYRDRLIFYDLPDLGSLPSPDPAFALKLRPMYALRMVPRSGHSQWRWQVEPVLQSASPG